MKWGIAWLLLFAVWPLFAFDQATAEKAYRAYQDGEQSTSVEKRKASFNEALALLLSMASEQPSAKLYYDLGNTYFQLGEYGFAILYYDKALKSAPRDSRVRKNLAIAQAKAGLPAEPWNFWHNVVLFFHYRVSSEEKAFIAMGLFAFAFVLASLHVWLRQPTFFHLAKWGAIVACIFLLSLFWVQYVAPPEAVLVQPCQLRRGPGTEYAFSSARPALAGLKVDVLEVTSGGSWVKVRLPTGEEGFAPKETARLI